MDILLLQQSWFRQEFIDRGHRAISAGLADHLDVVLPSPMLSFESVCSHLPEDFKPDAVVIHDNSGPLPYFALEECPLPVVFYSIDTHHHLALHKYIYQFVDKVFVAQKDYIRAFEQDQLEVEWLPAFASAYMDADENREREYGALFVGTLDEKLNPTRVEFFNRLKELVEIEITTGSWMHLFPKAEIIVNQTVKKDLNFRVFESMIAGAMLLTEDTGNGLRDIFTPGVHMKVYEKGNAEQAAQIIKESLANIEETRSIARAGRDEVVAHHLTKHRAAQILDAIENFSGKRESAIRFYSAMVNYSTIAVHVHKENTGVESRAVLAALAAAMKALDRKEPIGDNIAYHFVRSTLRYDALFNSQEGKELFRRARAELDLIPLFETIEIRHLLNEGKIDQARALAEASSSKPYTETFSAVESICTDIIEAEKKPVYKF